MNEQRTTPSGSQFEFGPQDYAPLVVLRFAILDPAAFGRARFLAAAPRGEGCAVSAGTAPSSEAPRPRPHGR